MLAIIAPDDAPRAPLSGSSVNNNRRGMAVLALGFGVLFSVARTARETAVTIPGIALGLAPYAFAEGEPSPPATAAAEAVMAQLDAIEQNVRSTRYRHTTEVNESLGIYDWDCSGMVDWVLRRAAPVAFGAFGRDRPVAQDIAQMIREAPADDERDGWRRITHVSMVRPGDVFAWESPRNLQRDGVTGHSGFVLDAPVRVVGLDEAYSIRVADSTTRPHQIDSRLLGLDFDGGFGRGTMTFAVDPDGAAYAYGWQGPWSPVFIRTDVEFGRVTR